MSITVVNKYKHFPTKHDVYIGRGSPLGNPYSHIASKHNVQPVASREEAIKLYEQHLTESLAKGEKSIVAEMNRIANAVILGNPINLVCFCKPCACHGDVIKQTILTKLSELNGTRDPS